MNTLLIILATVVAALYVLMVVGTAKQHLARMRQSRAIPATATTAPSK